MVYSTKAHVRHRTVRPFLGSQGERNTASVVHSNRNFRVFSALAVVPVLSTGFVKLQCTNQRAV